MKSLLTLLFLSYAVAASANSPAQNRWSFEVLLDDKPIGYHNFILSEKNGHQTISAEARFNVKLLFVNVFSYRHQNEFVVRGQAANEGFQVQAESSANKLPPCVMSFAYWNPEFLKAEKLLNSQTGDYEKVTIVKEGEEGLLVNGQNIQAIRYSVSGAAAPITLWYAAVDNRWLALESVVKGGRILRYKPVRLPDTLSASNTAGG